MKNLHVSHQRLVHLHATQAHTEHHRTENWRRLQVIGRHTTYIGDRHVSLNGLRVQIYAVVRHYPGNASCSIFYTDLELVKHGGVGPDDVVDVKPIAEDGTTGAVHDAMPRELACFVN